MLQVLKELPLWLRLWITFPLAVLNVWLLLLLFHYLQPLPSLLITAIVLAFLLNFPIQFLQQRGIDRGWAVGIVLIATLLLIGVLGVTLIPLIVEQLSGLVSSLPDLIESGNQQLQNLRQWAITQRLPVRLGGATDQLIARLSEILEASSTQLLTFVVGTIGSLVNIGLLLVLTVFMVVSGENAWKGIFSWLPAAWGYPLREAIEETFQSYFLTQALLAGIVGAAQTIAFLVLGVPYAVLFGVSIGLTTLIPYASAFVILLISAVVALQDFSLGIRVLVAAIVIGQINDNAVSPRLMGNSIGLNPIWLIIALFMGGKLAGVLGLLVAVPIASVIKRMADTMRPPSRFSLEELN